MLQRKQTIFLLLSVGLLLFTLFSYFVQNDNIFFDAFVLKIKTGADFEKFLAIPIAIFLVINIVITFFSIFLFKRRIVQMRIVMLSLILSIGFYGLLIFYHYWIKQKIFIDFSNYNYTLISPLIAAILDFMAYSGIKSDEKLVQQSNRIR